jgi:hypothetical protein
MTNANAANEESILTFAFAMKFLIFVLITEPPFDFDRGYHKLTLKKRKCNQMYFICNISTKNI